MAEHVLISPLGRSPGVVSGTALALSKGDNGHLGNFAITRVIAVGTSHPDVIKANQLLTKLFHATEIRYEAHLIRHAELKNDDNSTDEFMITMGQALESVHGGGNTVHMSITGGRSGMGALAALATNVYGADCLWFLWVSEDIEDNGRIDKMPKPIRLENNKYLDPTLAEGEYQLVPLPFLDLRPFHPLIKSYYRAQRKSREQGKPVEILETISPLVQLLAESGISRLESVFPATFSVRDADRLLELAQHYNSIPVEEQPTVWIELGRIFSRASITDPATEQRLRQLIESGAPPDVLRTIAHRAKDNTGFWSWLGDNFEQVTTATTIVGTLLKAAELWWKMRNP